MNEYQTPDQRAHAVAVEHGLNDMTTNAIAREIHAADEYLRDQMRGLDAIVVKTRAERDAAVKRAEEAEKRAAFPDRPRCAYCDWEGNEETTWEILRAHIESCPTHPIAQLTDRATRAEQERDEAMRELIRARESIARRDTIAGLTATRARVAEVEGALRDAAARYGASTASNGIPMELVALLTPATRGEERCEAECPACHFGVPQDGHRLCDGCEAVEARRDICTTACDHGSPCLLRAGHGGGHETQHGCVCYDPRPTPARDGESSNA